MVHKEESSKNGLTEEDIVNELDELLIDHLQLIDVYTKSMIQEETLFRDGLISIAHARICMIPNMISTSGIFREGMDDLTAASTVIVKGEDQQQCRVLSIDIKKDKELLGLFGKNIPSGLKRAQTSFQHVLENILDRVNILSKLDLVYRNYRELIVKRKELCHDRIDHEKENNILL